MDESQVYVLSDGTRVTFTPAGPKIMSRPPKKPSLPKKPSVRTKHKIYSDDLEVLEMLNLIGEDGETKSISNTCKHKQTGFSLTYDAAYCLSCREWLESACGDPGCDYCRKRPALAPDGLEDKEKGKLNDL